MSKKKRKIKLKLKIKRKNFIIFLLIILISLFILTKTTSSIISAFKDNKKTKEVELTDKEKKLLFIMLVMPDELVLTPNNEIRNVYLVRSYLDYVFKTENLIKPYYSNT